MSCSVRLKGLGVSDGPRVDGRKQAGNRLFSAMNTLFDPSESVEDYVDTGERIHE